MYFSYPRAKFLGGKTPKSIKKFRKKKKKEL